MDVQTILEIKPALTGFLRGFDHCMGRGTNRRHLQTYVSGQLSDLDRKSIEPIADAAGVSSRTLQEFLSLLRWDEVAARDALQQSVPAITRIHTASASSTRPVSTSKERRPRACRDNTVGAAASSKTVSSVCTSVTRPETFIRCWTANCFCPKRRGRGIGSAVVKRAFPTRSSTVPNGRSPLGQVRRALANGVRFGWFTFDEYYGGTPEFLRELEGLGQNFVAEIPVSFYGWTQPPEVLPRDPARDQNVPGVRRRKPRLKVKNAGVGQVRNVLKHSPLLRKVPWVKYQVKEGQKGPIRHSRLDLRSTLPNVRTLNQPASRVVVEAKRIPFWIKDEQGLPSRPYWLLVVRPVLHPEEVKFFLSNAPDSTPIEVLLLVAYSRWRVERLFEDTKSELGMDHFEVRKYLSIQRHLVLTCISHLFVAEYRLDHGGEKPGPDRVSGAYRHPGLGAHLESGWTMLASTGRSAQRHLATHPETQLPCAA